MQDITYGGLLHTPQYLVSAHRPPPHTPAKFYRSFLTFGITARLEVGKLFNCLFNDEHVAESPDGLWDGWRQVVAGTQG